MCHMKSKTNPLIKTIQVCAERCSSMVVGMVAALTFAVSLSGCGGGAPERDGVYVARSFDVHVIATGQDAYRSYPPSDTVHRVSLPAGEFVEFDASESVVWDLIVGGVAVSGPGVTVYYSDVAITLAELSSSRIMIDTAIRYPLAAPLSITLVATSTRYWDQVARFEVLLTP